MLVKAIEADWKLIPENIRPFISAQQTKVKPGRQYRVIALSIYKSVLFVLIFDDHELLSFVPSCYFETIDSTVPNDWICSLSLGAMVDLVIGPEFIAKSLDSYNRTVDLEADQVEKIWRWAHREILEE